MTRIQLIELGYKITNSEGTEEEVNDLIDLFDRNVPHPNGANLFYWPENYNSRKCDISTYNPSVEEVVDLTLRHKPTLL